MDLTKRLSEFRDLYTEISDNIVINDPKDDFEEAYNDAVRMAWLSGYLAGATDAVFQDTEAVHENVAEFNALLDKLQRNDHYVK